MTTAGLAASAGCAKHPPPRSEVGAKLTKLGLADAGSYDAASSWKTDHEREVYELGAPPRLFLSRGSAPPRGFVDLARRRSPAAPLRAARMFAFDFADPYYGSCEKVVSSDGSLCPSAVYPGVALNEEQTRTAAAIAIGAPEGWNTRPIASCFEPHHAIVFFDDRGVPVAELTVCFECGNLRIEPGPADEAGMTDGEAAFFAETCRALGVGGCPPLGSNRLPDEPAPEAALDIVAAQALRTHRAAARDPGIPPERPLIEMSTSERNVLSSWLASVMRVPSPYGYACADGRRGVYSVSASSTKGRDACAATVGQWMECVRSRVDSICSPGAPACAVADRCRWGVYRDENDAGT